MKHSIRNNSYELECAKREFLEEMESVPAYRWEDSIEIEADVPEEWEYDSVVDYFGTFGVDF